MISLVVTKNRLGEIAIAVVIEARALVRRSGRETPAVATKRQALVGTLADMMTAVTLRVCLAATDTTI